MKFEKTDRGFRRCGIICAPYHTSAWLQESSIVGNYDNSIELSGSSALWVQAIEEGTEAWVQLDRENVAKLVGALQHWLREGGLPETSEQ